VHLKVLEKRKKKKNKPQSNKWKCLDIHGLQIEPRGRYHLNRSITRNEIKAVIKMVVWWVSFTEEDEKDILAALVSVEGA
jgi:hypothetical protein